MSRDSIVYINVDTDVDTFIRVVDMNGSEELITDEAIHFFVGRAVSYSCSSTDVDYLVGRVMDKIQTSIRRYYDRLQDTSDIERRIINAWVTLADSIKDQLENHIYEKGSNRKNKALALRSYSSDGELAVIVCERDEIWERGENDDARNDRWGWR